MFGGPIPQLTHFKHIRTGARREKTAHLRLLATTDIHMRLTGFDYFTDRATRHHGLAGLASLIRAAREEAKERHHGCLLFDNGDMLQGTAMGAWLAQQSVTTSHPVVKCLNALEYDAIGIGNHDLDFGLDYLKAVARHLNMPVIASNLGGPSLAPLLGSALVKCALPSAVGDKDRTVTLGVISVLPALTRIWNQHMLNDVAHVGDPQACVATAVPKLRQQGADIVVVLAHMGLAEGKNDTAQAQNTAIGLTDIPGIDAMIMGHTHRRFPTPQSGNPLAARHPTDATLGSVPAVMPGHAGSDLAVLDLTLNQSENGRWSVAKHMISLRQNDTNTAAEDLISDAMRPTQKRLRAYLSTKVGQTPIDLHNFFSTAAPTTTARLYARAMARMIKPHLQNTDDQNLPLLAATSAHTAGGREGPDHYLYVPKGPVQRRHLNGLDPYNNQVWAIRTNGAALRARLEHAARIFNQLQPDHPEQLLIRDDIPAFNFDTIYGLTYQIDPTQPTGDRIKNLRFNGNPITSDQRFILGTNQFRAAGGSGYDPICPQDVVWRSHHTAEQALIETIQDPEDTIWDDATPWSFACKGHISAILFTSPLAIPFLDQVPELRAQMEGTVKSGFARLRLTL